MPIQPPEIDTARFAEILDAVLRRARQSARWQPRDPDEPAMALVAIYAHYLELILQRLNRVPEKNLIVFLDMLGIGRLPPGAARAPAVFTLAPTATAAALVPVGTQVATLQTETRPAVLYETTQDLNVVPAHLTAAFTIEPDTGPGNPPDRDHFADRSAAVRREDPISFNPFLGNRLIDHILYLGFPEEMPVLIQRPGKLEVELQFKALPAQPIRDAVRNDLTWEILRSTGPETLAAPDLREEGTNLRLQLARSVVSTDPDRLRIQGPDVSEIGGLGLPQSLRQHWLRARMNRPLRRQSDPLGDLLKVTRVVLIAQAGLPIAEAKKPEAGGPRAEELQPDAGALNTVLSDLTKPFPLLGEHPRRDDAFYIGSQEVFAQKGATVYVRFRLSQEGIPTPGFSTNDPAPQPPTPLFRLVWEYPDGRQWRTLGEIRAQFKAGDIDFNCEKVELGPGSKIDDTTTVKRNSKAFFQNGAVTFVVPPDIAPVEVAGQRRFWVRVRIAEGDFGRPAEFFVNQSGELTRISQKMNTGNLKPPVVEALTLGYDYGTARIQPTFITLNGFRHRDRSEENAGALTKGPIFVSTEETEPTFYLGFDRTLPNSAVNLFFVVPPRQFFEKLETGSPAPPSAPPRLGWQYWNGLDWIDLLVADDTRSFTESGIVQFLGPADMAALASFDAAERFWIRVRRLAGGPAYVPLVDGIYLNAVEVSQAATVTHEVLGSSSGRKNQSFRLAKTPVQSGQQIVLLEPEPPAAAEARILQEEEGADAIQIDTRPDGSLEIRVRWHEVGTLNQSDLRSRHYTLDRNSGEIRFGDGERGLIPPPGRDNILALTYRAGGGPDGNQRPGAISQLKSAVPFVTAITNPIASDGGSRAEPLPAVLERGPQLLRHRGRAVTAEDFEWLARQAAGTRVARARCLPNRNPDLDFQPGWVTLILVPDGEEKKLLPSAQLVREVEDDLATRELATLATATPARLNVIGPGYVPVELRVQVMPLALTRAEEVRSAVLAGLDRFLHPLLGGPDGAGWLFGRDVHLSELFAALEDLPGVEHVHSLSFKPTAAALPLRLDPPSTLPPVEAYPRGGHLALPDGSVVTKLAEPFQPEAGSATAMTLLFQEGERLRVGPEPDAVEVTVRAISGNLLTVDPFRAPVPYPAGTTVGSSPLTGSRSQLTAPIERDTLVNQFAVRLILPDQRPDPVHPTTVNLTLPDGTQSLSFTLAAIQEDGLRRFELGTRLRVPDFCLVYSGTHTVEITDR